MALVLLLALHPAGVRAERPFDTLAALGWIQPVASEEGLPTPVVVIDHLSGDPDQGGALAASLRTATARTGWRTALGTGFDLELGARGRYTIEGDGRDLYVSGQRDSDSSFQGHSLAAIVAGHILPRAAWRLTAEAERMYTRFFAHAETGPAYRLPSDFRQNETRLGVARAGLLQDEAEARAMWTEGHREGWERWALETDPDRSRRYRKYALEISQPFSPAGQGGTELGLKVLSGEGLDLFSGYDVGGLGGDLPLGGYYRNEFRARRVAWLEARHELRFSDDRRLTFFAQAAHLREQTLPLAGHRPGDRRLAGVGLTVWYGIRSLGGLPVILTYAEGLIVPDGAKESHRREVALVLAAGF